MAVKPDAATTDNGETPLHYAARRGFESIAQQLTEAGADLNKQTRDNGATLCTLQCRIGKGQ